MKEPVSAEPDSAAQIAHLLAEVARLEESERRHRLSGAHVRRHLLLLAEAGQALVGPVDDEDAVLGSLVAAVVGSFADWCGVDLMRDGRLCRVAEAQAGGAADHPVPAPGPGWDAPSRRVMGSGQSELMWDFSGQPKHPEDGDHFTSARSLGLDSCVIVPIRIESLSVGAITCGTRPPRRGYRPSDQQALEQLALRVGTAIERISLYRETQRAAAESTGRAAQLRRLMSAAVALQPQHRTGEVVAVAAREAARVLGAERGAAQVAGLDGSRALAGGGGPWPDEDLLTRAEGLPRGGVAGIAGAMAVRLEPGDSKRGGVLAVAGPGPLGFTEEDETILVALAQMVSVALDNARLYESVQTGEARLLAMVEAAPVAMFQLDLKGAVVRANSTAHDLLGSTGHWRDAPALHPATQALLAQVAADILAGQSGRDVEAPTRRADGSEVSLSLAGAPLRSGAGAVDGVVITATDLTARLLLRDQLVRAQRIEAVGQVAGGVAHDFNNLLTVVLGHAALLNMSLPEGDEMREDVDAISEAAERAVGITSQLLTISRGELVATEVFDARARLRRLADSTLRSLLPESVELRLTDGPGRMVVRMSPAQFDQVILNLAINGRDAMPESGRLSIRLYEENGVVIEVADNGSGMDADTAARCFEPFFSTKGGLRGTGLGLATVQSVVTGVGGELSLRTEPGRGTTFTVRLPRAAGPVDAAGPARPDSEKGSERILLVEDETGLRRLAVEVLRGAGYVVTPALDGAVALGIIENGNDPFDLVVTDVVMPKVGGLELARRLHDRYPETPVLFLTGYEDQPDGADVLLKPFLVEDLVDRVRAALDRAGPLD